MLKTLFIRFKWQIILASVLSTISAFLGLKMLSIITEIIGGIGGVDFEPAYSFLSFSAIAFGVISFGVLSQFILLKLSTTVVYEVRKTILERILGTDYAIIEKNGNHKIMAAMKDDVSSISAGLNLLPDFIYSAVTVILCLSYLIYSAWQLFLLVAAVILLIIFITRLVLKYALVYQESLREDHDQFFSNLNALSNGGKELHVSQNRKRHFYRAIMLPLFKSMKNKTMKASGAFIGLDSFVSTMVFFLIGIVIYVSLAYFPNFESQIIVTFTLVILYMVEPLGRVIEVGDEANEVFVALNKITRLKLEDSSVFLSSIEKPIPQQLHCAEIQLKDIVFIHENKEDGDSYQFKLGPVSAEFKSGEITFITGGNGSGKSTFAKLISGLYKAESGIIYVDGQEIGPDASLTLDEYMNSISVIFADSFVFTHILDNKGLPGNDFAIQEHLKQLELAERVESIKGILSSTKLSTGQGKRLALLQSFMVDTRICIYDEWAAEQDPAFKDYFYRVILPELKRRGKIVIVITHDSQYFDAADQLLELESGKIINVKKVA
ncbi:cyclic peptide export ABC transporter [Marinicella sp. W31]|uniref:cyclic peptide export ABC transporter n=1 Tax=Marinicella sp. W31 TaxID=3023713 RepID=UPI003756A172